MTAPADESPPTLLDYFLTLETPEGLRAELIEEQIFVTPAPDGDHEDHLSTLVRQVLRRSRTDMDCSAHKGLKTYGIPDATFAPRARRLFRGAPTWMPCDGVSMVAEVTGRDAHRDRVTKRRLYARAGIPLYLLVDRDKATVTLFSEPVQGDYAEPHSVPYGKPLPLPRTLRLRPGNVRLRVAVRRITLPPWPRTSTTPTPPTSPSGASGTSAH